MIVQLEHVTKSYGDVVALDDVSMEINGDEIVALLGPNGAGKTTGLEIALGLRAPDAGSARLFGVSPHEARVRCRVGATPQETGFPDMLRVREILAFVAAHYPSPMAADSVLRDFGLEGLAGRRAGALSGGESRRLAVAVAFAGNPDLVVLDEPTTGLDVESRRVLWRRIEGFASRRCVLFTTHYLEEAEAHATRIIVIDAGRMLFDGRPAQLRRRVGGRRITYATPVDGNVSVNVNDADAYVRELVASGTPFRDLEIGRPSLEEAFLTLTGGQR